MLRRSFPCGSPKVVSSVVALRDVSDGVSIAVGGFGLCGAPLGLLSRLHKDGRRKLHIISAVNGGGNCVALGPLLRDHQVETITTSYVGLDTLLCTQLVKGDVRLDLCPLGSLAERLRCGGAGIPAFYTPTGFGTDLAAGNLPVAFASDGSGRVTEYSEARETREIRGRWCVLEHAIHADYAFIKAWKADKKGNLVFRGTGRNMNAAMATCANTCIAEVEEIVELGELGPNEVHVPSVYVDRIVLSESTEGLASHVVVSDRREALTELNPRQERIVKRAALELHHGMHVKLGIGMSSMVTQFLPPNVNLEIHHDCGMLCSNIQQGKGKPVDMDPACASNSALGVPQPGDSFFDTNVSFAMLQGKHMDVTLLDAFQVSATGDIAGWHGPEKVPSVDTGTMDILCGGGRGIALLEHVDQDGKPRIVEQCDRPVTGRQRINTIITDLAVFDVVYMGGNARQLMLRELAEDVTVKELQEKTAAPFLLPTELRRMSEA